MFEKMLDAPYKRVGVDVRLVPKYYSHDIQDDSEMALAPARPLCLRLLINPTFNLNALSEKDVNMLQSLDFNVLAFHQRIPNEFEREHYLWMLLMKMFYKLDLVREFQISELNLYRYISLAIIDTNVGKIHRNCLQKIS